MPGFFKAKDSILSLFLSQYIFKVNLFQSIRFTYRRENKDIMKIPKKIVYNGYTPKPQVTKK